MITNENLRNEALFLTLFFWVEIKQNLIEVSISMISVTCDVIDYCKIIVTVYNICILIDVITDLLYK